MTRDPSGPTEVTDIAIDARRVGPGTAHIEDDVLVVAAAGVDGPRTVARWRLESIAGVRRAGTRVDVENASGLRLVLHIDVSSDFDARLRSGARAIPELTRAMRWMGSSRGDRASVAGTGHRAEPRFFAPLLEARKAGARAGTPREAIEAFQGERLTRQLDDLLASIAEERHAQHPARRRALEAELLEIAEPLYAALSRVDTTGAHAATDVDDLRRWRAWSREVGRMFEIADQVWPGLRRALDRQRTAVR